MIEMLWRSCMLWLLVLGAIGAAAVPAAAQTPAPEGDPANAATWYRAAYDEAKRIGFNTTEEYEPVWAFQTDPDRGPSAEARAIIRRAREAVNLVRRATRRDTCDFGPYDPFGNSLAQGPGPAPHVRLCAA